MILCMRWFGEGDLVPLEYLRQVPGVKGIVSALYDVEVGEIWPLEKLRWLKARVEATGLSLEVIESIPVHEAIKLGLPERDRFIENYLESLRNIAQVGVRVLCYNFMPIFDWIRTDLARPLPDGSTTLSFAQQDLEKIDLSRGIAGLPGWAGAFDAKELRTLLERYRQVDSEQLFQNFAYFLRAVVPVAEEVGVCLALHPDDPPWPIFGLPRIVTDEKSIQRLLDVVKSPHHGLTFCTGSLGASPANDLLAMVRRFAGRIHFVHARNVRVNGERSFFETAHPTEYGDVDMRALIQAILETGYRGPIRSDHGRMIWGERGRPGYGLYDRALGSTYLYGLIEGVGGRGRV